MSRLSIYENAWIDLVFENRNKEYGAYQLRRESSKTAVMAFISGIALITVLGLIVTLSNLVNKPIILETPTIFDEVIRVTPYSSTPEKPKTIAPTTQTKSPTTSSALAPMVVATTTDVIAEVPINTESASANSGSDTGTENGTVNATPSTTNIETPTVADEKAIISSGLLDKLPEFPGGIKKFYSYVGNNFEKPDLESMNTFRVYVAFVIERDGSMTDIKVLKDPGHGLGAEAIRVLKSLKTKWSPGMIGSKPVRTSYNLPITIEMN